MKKIFFFAVVLVSILVSGCKADVKKDDIDRMDYFDSMSGICYTIDLLEYICSKSEEFKDYCMLYDRSRYTAAVTIGRKLGYIETEPSRTSKNLYIEAMKACEKQKAANNFIYEQGIGEPFPSIEKTLSTFSEDDRNRYYIEKNKITNGIQPELQKIREDMAEKARKARLK